MKHFNSGNKQQTLNQKVRSSRDSVDGRFWTSAQNKSAMRTYCTFIGPQKKKKKPKNSPPPPAFSCMKAAYLHPLLDKTSAGQVSKWCEGIILHTETLFLIRNSMLVLRCLFTRVSLNPPNKIPALLNSENLSIKNKNKKTKRPHKPCYTLLKEISYVFQTR